MSPALCNVSSRLAVSSATVCCKENEATWCGISRPVAAVQPSATLIESWGRLLDGISCSDCSCNCTWYCLCIPAIMQGFAVVWDDTALVCSIDQFPMSVRPATDGASALYWFRNFASDKTALQKLCINLQLGFHPVWNRNSLQSA